MKAYDRTRLLIHVAKLYYESDYSQEQIANSLDLSRPYVSKLLNAAKNEGIVQIRVIDSLNLETSMEKEFRKTFGLDKVIIVPSNVESDPLRYVGEAAARFLNSIIENGDIIGGTWGDTMFQLSRVLVQRYDLENLMFVQLCGGISNINSPVHASEIAYNFQQRLGCTSYLLQLPAIVGSKELNQMLQEDDNIKKVMDMGRASRIALFTVGAFGAEGKSSALVRANYLNEEQTAMLAKRGAVGDICTHVIDIDGNICDPELDDRCVAITLDAIKEKEYRICVAQGVSKEAAILGALKTGIVNVFITNEKTAIGVLNRYKEN